ncbi:uncharacterized protein [Elaeis guineensis]|uniref:uncharacterized protein n=1 Tax=Elaeis guineensis var. tenera TaxID=51953 RepID=UPI003C6D2766
MQSPWDGSRLWMEFRDDTGWVAKMVYYCGAHVLEVLKGICPFAFSLTLFNARVCFWAWCYSQCRDIRTKSSMVGKALQISLFVSLTFFWRSVGRRVGDRRGVLDSDWGFLIWDFVLNCGGVSCSLRLHELNLARSTIFYKMRDLCIAKEGCRMSHVHGACRDPVVREPSTVDKSNRTIGPLSSPTFPTFLYASTVASMPAFHAGNWKWENAAAGAVAGFATVAALHPLDVVRTRFQVSDGRVTILPLYKNTAHAVYTIARTEVNGTRRSQLLADKSLGKGLRGLYAGFYPAVFGSTLSWGLYFFFYSRAKHRYCKGNDGQLSPGYHLVSAAEAGALVCLCTNPIWLVKTRLQLQTPQHYQPYSGFSDALRTILREEGWRALYKGIGPGLLLFDSATIQIVGICQI